MQVRRKWKNPTATLLCDMATLPDEKSSSSSVSGSPNQAQSSHQALLQDVDVDQSLTNSVSVSSSGGERVRSNAAENNAANSRGGVIEETSLPFAIGSSSPSHKPNKPKTEWPSTPPRVVQYAQQSCESDRTFALTPAQSELKCSMNANSLRTPFNNHAVVRLQEEEFTLTPSPLKSAGNEIIADHISEESVNQRGISIAEEVLSFENPLAREDSDTDSGISQMME